MERVPNALVVGSLMYAMLCTRPNISYAVSVISKYQFDLGEKHWVVVKHIFKHLRRTKNMVLVCGGGDLCVDRFTDCNF